MSWIVDRLRFSFRRLFWWFTLWQLTLWQLVAMDSTAGWYYARMGKRKEMPFLTEEDFEEGEYLLFNRNILPALRRQKLAEREI